MGMRINKSYLFTILSITLLATFVLKTKTGQNLMTKISENGIKFLQSVEGFSSKAYWDVKGWSIGFGHFMGATKTLDNISYSKAIELLMNDLSWSENVIKKYVKVSLTQNQHDALVSFIYNLGETNFAKSTLLKKLNANDFVGAANEFKNWNKERKNGVLVINNVLVNRREKERQLFLS